MDNTLENAIEHAQWLELLQAGETDPWSDPGKNNRSNTNSNTGSTQYVPMEIDGTK